MIKIAVCEDNQTCLSLLYNLIEDYRLGAAAKCEIKCHAFSFGDQLIQAVERGMHFDIVLIDILMPGINGIDTAKELRHIGYDSIIVFISTSKDFALDSYAVKAYDYLVKPVTRERLFSLLDETIEKLQRQATQCIVINQASGVTKIYFQKIRYVEVIQKRLYFYMSDGSLIKTVGTMAAIEKLLLADARFLKPHRSYMVNMDYVDTVTSKEICMLDQTKIPVPKAISTKIKTQFIDYYLNSK